MKNKSIIRILKLVILTILFIIIVCINNEVLGASAKINAPSKVYVGDKITISITGNAASWSGLTLKASGPISGSGGIMADSTSSGENENVTMGTYTFTATSAGNATFTLSGLVVDSNYTKSNVSNSKVVQIVEKEEPKKENTITSNTKPTTTKPTTTKPNTTTKPSTSTTKPTETSTGEKTETKEDDFYINSISLKGVKENGEKLDEILSPEFNKEIYEYTCNVEADIKNVEIEKDAGQYSTSVVINGLEELKTGENIITLMLSAENHKAKTYTIKVIKAEQEIVETSATTIETDNNGVEEINKKEKESIIISMPLWSFIAMQFGIVTIEALVICFVPWRKIFKIKNQNIDIEE